MTNKNSEKYVKFCPKCNSTDIKIDFSNPGLLGSGFVNTSRCNHCGYSTNFFPENEVSKIQPIKKIENVEKRELVNATYGKTINWWWRKIGPIGILSSLILIFFIKDEIFFYVGLVMMLPLFSVITLTSYRNDLIQKYRLLKIISILIYLYTITFAPLLVVYLTGRFN
jgi:hypothetical protein